MLYQFNLKLYRALKSHNACITCALAVFRSGSLTSSSLGCIGDGITELHCEISRILSFGLSLPIQIEQLRHKFVSSVLIIPMSTFSRLVQCFILSLIAASAPAFAQPRPTPPQTPQVLPAAPSVETQVTAIAEQFIDLVASGEFEQAHQMLNPTLREGWTVAQMRDDWRNLQRITGRYSARTGTEIIDSSLVLVNLKFQKVEDNMLVIFDDQQQIRGVDFPLQLPRQ